MRAERCSLLIQIAVVPPRVSAAGLKFVFVGYPLLLPNCSTILTYAFLGRRRTLKELKLFIFRSLSMIANWSAHTDTQQQVAAVRRMLRAGGLQR